MRRLVILSILALLGFSGEVSSQEVVSVFGRVYADPVNGPGYFRPLANVLNTSLSLHWFTHKSEDSPKFGISVIAVRAWIPSEYTSYEGRYTVTSSMEERIVEVPTVFGENRLVRVEEANGYTHVFPGGFDYQHLTVAVPQITVEGLLNTAISLRFISFLIDEEVGQFKTFGIALEHHVSPYFKADDWIASVAGGISTIDAGDLLETGQGFLSTTFGREFSHLRLYTTLGYQWYHQAMQYEDPFQEPSLRRIDVRADNEFLWHLGLGAEWLFLQGGIEIAPLAPTSVGFRLGVRF